MELNSILKAMEDSQLHFSIDNNPSKEAVQINENYSQHIRRLILHSYGNELQLAVLLPQEDWLNIRITFEQQPVLMMLSISLALFCMAITSFLLCGWAIRRLAIPLTNFLAAAKRLGNDVNAPMLVEQGPLEIRQATRAFNEMQLQIQRLLNNRTQLLAAISHDLRTPITRLKLRAEYVSDSLQYPKILADLAEMENMIRATLNFIRDDVQTESRIRFDINAMLEALCHNLTDAGYNVDYHSDHQRLPFLGRTNALKRACSNLIENAVKYGQCARVKLQQQHDSIRIEIDDDGPGIPESEFSKVFEPFYRIEYSRSRETGGTGLGMAIAQDIIRSHQGEIRLFNRPEGGLRVTVEFELVKQ